MKSMISVISSIALAASPSLIQASSQFATVDSTRLDGESTIITSLASSAEIGADDSEIINVDGLLVFNGRGIPLSVGIQTYDGDSAPTIDELQNAGVLKVMGSSSYTPKNIEVEVVKTLYSVYLRDKDDKEIIASIVVTDDPVPAVAWLVFAGIASLTGLTAYAISECKKVSLVTDTDIKEEKVRTELTCDKD